MDLLTGIGLEQLRMWIWILVIGFAVAAGLWRRHQLVAVALASVLLFAAASAGAGIYILKRPGDPRWTMGEPPVNAPDLSGIPVVGKQLAPVESALESIAGGVNSFWEFNQALPVALDFFERSGWALLAAIPLIIAMMIKTFRAASRRRQELKNLSGAVAQLQSELAAIKGNLSEQGTAAEAPEQGSQRENAGTRRSRGGE
ncbi:MULTISPECIES: hypothetical protein [unclassified Glutamicibacter]|uniref:hypothetical protein n=1 Tax=unclassified Glutamicibacter TaxID=2627139 RepID=UPI003806DAFA